MNPLFEQHLQQLREQLSSLPDKPEESADYTLHALWVKSQGNTCSAQRAQQTALRDLNPAEANALAQRITQRLQGAPLAHLMERQDFMGLELIASPAALIPRVETELLVNLALSCVAHQAPLILDVCTGSGNIALALAQHIPQAKVFGADISQDAIALAQSNSQHTALSKRTSFKVGNLLEPFVADPACIPADLIVCNPPYITSTKVKAMPQEIAQHEPALAFDGGPLGISIIEQLINSAPALLKTEGWLCFEVGLGQGEFIEKRILKSGKYKNIRQARDADNNIRALACQTCQEAQGD